MYTATALYQDCEVSMIDAETYSEAVQMCYEGIPSCYFEDADNLTIQIIREGMPLVVILDWGMIQASLNAFFNKG